MLKVYNQSMQLVAYLENAFSIGYEQRDNELWTAWFSMPADDPKNEELIHFRYVELFDGEDRVDLFRIVPTKTSRSDSGKQIDYECEHVLATLIDDVLFQYHERDNLPTADVLGYILARQAVTRWTLGTVEISHQFSYKWENENLLAALFSVTKPFLDDFQWTWDTTLYPWRLNLIVRDATIAAYVRYRKNLRGIVREADPTQLCTRLYALGYGEGVNQLTIVGANPTGLPYIDADTQGTYGIISRIWVDRRYEDEETLYNAARAILELQKSPYLSYSIDAAELYQITNDPADRFSIGRYILAEDDDLGIDTVTKVVVRKRPDVKASPGEAQIEIANKTRDVADTINEMADRQRVHDVYAQGATNLDSHDFSDNCDSNNPAIIRFYIPGDTARINKMLLSYETGKFRAYSRATKGGGATTVTSEAGGSTTVTSSSGGGAVDTDSSWQILYPGISIDYTVSAGDPPHSHSLYNHGHRVNIPSHTHSVNIPNHTHDITLPDHTHEIEYGIFLREPAPTSVTVHVDGNLISGLGANGKDVDIVPYLSKDEEGKIQRGTWHEIKITPNDLGRIVANVVSQLFVQSRGGGDY